MTHVHRFNVAAAGAQPSVDCLGDLTVGMRSVYYAAAVDGLRFEVGRFPECPFHGQHDPLPVQQLTAEGRLVAWPWGWDTDVARTAFQRQPEAQPTHDHRIGAVEHRPTLCAAEAAQQTDRPTACAPGINLYGLACEGADGKERLLVAAPTFDQANAWIAFHPGAYAVMDDGKGDGTWELAATRPHAN